MAGLRITNCHAHTFTSRHVPRGYPHPAVAAFRWAPGLATRLTRASRLLPWEGAHHWLARMEAFQRTGERQGQLDVLQELLRYYPKSSRHVILPLDMEPAGHGPVRASLREQHDELARLARHPAYGAQDIPFATLHPDRPGAFDELRRCVEELGFRGLKLYPRMGFSPTHPLLMDEVYPYCAERSLPVVSHCSSRGVLRKGWSDAQGDEVSRPDAFVPVLRAFPALRVNLAHFGGWTEWRDFLDVGFDPASPGDRARNWVARICDLIAEEGHGNLFTDISYTLFRFGEFMPLLRLFMADPRLSRRILFGSDFYMTRQEELSEKAVSIRLRDALGEARFRQIAEANPEAWLGERADGPMPPPAR